MSVQNVTNSLSFKLLILLHSNYLKAVYLPQKKPEVILLILSKSWLGREDSDLVKRRSCNHFWLDTTLIVSSLDLEEAWNETKNTIQCKHFFTVSGICCEINRMPGQETFLLQPLSPQSPFQEFAASQYGVPFSSPHPRILIAWPPRTSPVTCW